MHYDSGVALVELVTTDDTAFVDCDAFVDTGIRKDLIARGYMKETGEPTPLGDYIGRDLAAFDEWCSWSGETMESYLKTLAVQFKR